MLSLSVLASCAHTQRKPTKAEARAAHIREVLADDKTHSLCEYDYDADGKWVSFSLRYPGGADKLLLVSMIESLAPKLVIRETRGIKRAALVKSASVSE